MKAEESETSGGEEAFAKKEEEEEEGGRQAGRQESWGEVDGGEEGKGYLDPSTGYIGEENVYEKVKHLGIQATMYRIFIIV